MAKFFTQSNFYVFSKFYFAGTISTKSFDQITMRISHTDQYRFDFVLLSKIRYVVNSNPIAPPDSENKLELLNLTGSAGLF